MRNVDNDDNNLKFDSKFIWCEVIIVNPEKYTADIN